MAKEIKTINELKQVRDIPAVVATEKGFITYINDSFQSTFQWKKEELLGAPLITFIPERFQDAHHLGFSRFLSTGIPTLLNKPLKLMALNKQGKEISCEHYIIAEKIKGEWVFGATIRPI